MKQTAAIRFILLAFCVIVVSYSCKKNDAQPTSQKQNGAPYDWTKLIVGADLSSVSMVEANGGVYTDSNKVKDPFVLLKQHGCNLVRVRLFNNPKATGGYSADGYCGIDDVVQTIQRSKNAGMAVNLDFHFSDTWADPGHQTMPAAWANVTTVDVLKDSVYNYVTAILNLLKSKNLTPEMVQIGNEIQAGMLFPVGSITGTDFSSLSVLLASGIKAVRDFSANSSIKPQIILHPGEPEVISWWLSGIKIAGITDYDVIGISYYESYSTTTFLQLPSFIQTLKIEFPGKKVLIAETAYQWTNQSQDGKVYTTQVALNGFPVSPQGQYNEVVSLTQNVITGGGIGVITWEPAWIANNQNFGEETQCFFDFKGNSQQACNFFNYSYQF